MAGRLLDLGGANRVGPGMHYLLMDPDFISWKASKMIDQMRQDANKMFGNIIPKTLAPTSFELNNADLKTDITKALNCSYDLRRGLPLNEINDKVLAGVYHEDHVDICQEAEH